MSDAGPRFPRISIVTPSFNQAEFLAATMESVHTSGYPDLEHIVIDGGSSDGSVAIINKYSDRLAYWRSRPDAGQTAAIAEGFAMATGEILCWLNSDDLFEVDTLHEVAEHFWMNPEHRFIYGDATWIDVNGAVIKPKREHAFNKFVWFWDHNYIPQPSTFWRRGLYDEVGGLDSTFDLAMDADLWIRFAQVTHPVHVPRAWSRMRFYPDQKNTLMRSESLREMARIRARHGRTATGVAAVARRALARGLRVGLKVAAGGYPFEEIRSHLAGFGRRGSWEERQSARYREES